MRSCATSAPFMPSFLASLSSSRTFHSKILTLALGNPSFRMTFDYFSFWPSLYSILLSLFSHPGKIKMREKNQTQPNNNCCLMTAVSNSKTTSFSVYQDCVRPGAVKLVLYVASLDARQVSSIQPRMPGSEPISDQAVRCWFLSIKLQTVLKTTWNGTANDYFLVVHY